MGICGSTNDKAMDDVVEKHLSKTLTRLNIGKPEVHLSRTERGVVGRGSLLCVEGTVAGLVPRQPAAVAATCNGVRRLWAPLPLSQSR